jgi:hypothetical protein
MLATESTGVDPLASEPDSLIERIVAKLSSVGSLPRTTKYALAAALSFLGKRSVKLKIIIKSLLVLQNFPANILYNPSFEYDTVGQAPAWWLEYTQNGPTEKTFQVSETWAALGKKSLHVIATLKGSGGEQRMGIEAPYNPQETAYAGETRYLTAVVNVISIPEKTHIAFETSFSGSTGNFIGAGGGRVNITTTGQYFVECVGVAPTRSFSVYSAIYAVTESTEATGKVEYYLDKLSLGRSKEYVDGDTIGYRWAGNPGNSITYSFAFAQNTKKQFATLLSFAGNLIQGIVKGISASLSFSGTLQIATSRVQTATLTYLSSLRRSIEKFAPELSFAGTAFRNIKYQLLANLSFSGSLLRLLVRTLVASLNLVNILPRNINRQASGSLNPEGSLGKNISATLAETLAFVGFLRPFADFIQRISASLVLSSNQGRSIIRTLAASVTPNGSLRRSIEYRLEGILQATGAVRRTIVRRLEGILSFSKEIPSKTYHQLSSNMTFAGTARRSMFRQLDAVIDFKGAIIPIVKIIQMFAAALGFSSHIARLSISRVLRGAVRFEGFLSKIKGAKPIPDMLVLKYESLPTLTLRRNESDDTLGLVSHLEGFPEMEVQPVVRRRQVFGRKG